MYNFFYLISSCFNIACIILDIYIYIYIYIYTYYLSIAKQLSESVATLTVESGPLTPASDGGWAIDMEVGSTRPKTKTDLQQLKDAVIYLSFVMMFFLVICIIICQLFIRPGSLLRNMFS